MPNNYSYDVRRNQISAEEAKLRSQRLKLSPNPLGSKLQPGEYSKSLHGSESSFEGEKIWTIAVYRE